MGHIEVTKMDDAIKLYMYDMITDYWKIIKKHGIDQQDPTDGELRKDINNWHKAYVKDAPTKNINEFGHELLNGLVMLYVR